MHEDFIFNAARGVSGQFNIFIGIKGAHRFHQPDGADGNKILLIARQGVIFFYDVRHQPQVALNEHVARLQIALQPGVEIFALLGLTQRTRERAAGRQAQHQKCTAHHQHQGTVQHFQPSVSACGHSIRRLQVHLPATQFSGCAQMLHNKALITE